MQNTPVYLLNQRTDIISNESGNVTEYRPVYEKKLKIYKGIDNKLQFRLLNADQKPQDVSALTPYFTAYDENKSNVIEKIGTILQTSDSTVFKNKGLFEIELSAADIQDIDNQFLHYNIYFKDVNNVDVLTYVNSHFGATNTLHLMDTIYPDPQLSINIDTFTANLDLGDPITEWISESVYASPHTNNNDALHSVAIYTDNYVGNILIQGTLENQLTEFTDWSDIETISFSGAETTPKYENFNGVFTYLRFIANADPKNAIEKILIRN